MAAPTPPTLSVLVAEGLYKAGYSSPSTALTTRAEGRWMAEIKNDIWTVIKDAKMLEQTAYRVLTLGQSRFSMPTDYSSKVTATLLDGNHYGTATGGGASSITLAADEDINSGDIIGKEIFVYSGTGINQASQVLSYSTTTKIATVATAWTTQPVSGDGYIIVDRYTPLTNLPIWDYDSTSYPTEQGTPTHFFEAGNSEYLVYPVPYRTGSIPFGIKLRYYANLLTLDLAGTLMSTLYQRWEGVWVQGIFAKALQNMDDSRAIQEQATYMNLLKSMVAREKTAINESAMRATIVDYD